MVIFTGPILPLPTAGVGNPYQNFSWTQLHDTLTEKVQQNDDLPVVPYMGMYASHYIGNSRYLFSFTVYG